MHWDSPEALETVWKKGEKKWESHGPWVEGLAGHCVEIYEKLESNLLGKIHKICHRKHFLEKNR